MSFEQLDRSIHREINEFLDLMILKTFIELIELNFKKIYESSFKNLAKILKLELHFKEIFQTFSVTFLKFGVCSNTRMRTNPFVRVSFRVRCFRPVSKHKFDVHNTTRCTQATKCLCFINCRENGNERTDGNGD